MLLGKHEDQYAVAAPTGTALPTVLVVDDDPAIADGMHRILRGHAELLCASSGDGGRKIANSRHDIELLILDLTMPEYDAVEFLADLKEDGVFLPIVLMSGHSASLLDVVKRLAMAHGFTILDSMAKPFQTSRLINILETLPGRGN